MSIAALSHFHFLRPLFLLGLIPLFLIWFSIWMSRKRFSNWETVCDKHLLPHLLLSHAESFHRLPFVIIGLSWFLAIIALAGPSWSQTTFSLYRNTLAQIIAVDLSTNMYATDVRPNRISRLRYKLLDILNQQHEGQVGMIAFTRESFTISPLTEDAYTLSAMIPELEPKIMPVSGNDISQAIQYAMKLLEQSDESKGHIILITSAMPNTKDYQTAEKAHQLGYRVSVYGFGTTQGAPLITDQGFMKDNRGNIQLAKLDESKLKHLARIGGGIYIAFSDDDTDIKAINSLTEARTAPKQLSQQQLEVWHDHGRWFVFLLIPFAALAFRRGWFETIVS